MNVKTRILNGQNGIGYTKLFDMIHSLEDQYRPSMNEDLDYLKSYVKKIYDMSEVVGLYIDDEIVGVSAIYVNDIAKRQAYLTYISIMERYCNKGYGTLLIQEMENIALNYEMRNIKLEVYKNNYRAISFYKKQKFEISGDSSNIKKIFMEKRL